MTRSTLGAANRSEVTGNVVREIHLLEMQFPTGTLRYTTADRDIDFAGVGTFTHTGALGGVDGVAEFADLKARRLSIKISGEDVGVLTGIVGAYHNAKCRYWWGYCNEAWRLVADPYLVTDELLMSNATFNVDQSTGEIELSAETWDIYGQRDAAVLATPESQRARGAAYVSDSGMDKVAALMTTIVYWGGVAGNIGGFSGGRGMSITGSSFGGAGTSPLAFSGSTGGGGGDVTYPSPAGPNEA